MTLSSTDYLEINPISYPSKATSKRVAISSVGVIEVIIGANKYLHGLTECFKKLNFDIYATLGQRNLSGFIGEVFTNFFPKKINGFVVNPHPDGRPDLLEITSKMAKKYFLEKCFKPAEDGRLAPIRSNLAPFRFGGLEVKSTIGKPINNYNDQLQNDVGINSFSVGIPRIDYLSSITYWGHHISCENLLGLYYDYCEELKGTPQIMAVMHSELDPGNDWNPVSTGLEGSKKTSNTSLNKSGRTKIMGNPIVVRNNLRYIKKLRQIGLEI